MFTEDKVTEIFFMADEFCTYSGVNPFRNPEA